MQPGNLKWTDAHVVEKTEFDVPVLSLAGCYVRNAGTWILRPESISVTCNSLFVGLPLLQVRQKFGNGNELRIPSGTNKVWKTKVQLVQVQVLHLLRWFTHTPRSSGAFLEEQQVSELW